MSASPKSPNPTDIYVGGRIRLRRTMIGMSQERLAEFLGITFQQVQKYEKGTNRVGASRLQSIASALNVPVTFFFQQEAGPLVLDGIETPSEEATLSEFMTSKDGIVLNRAFLKIKDGRVRKSVVALTKAIAQSDQADFRPGDELDDDLATRHPLH